LTQFCRRACGCKTVTPRGIAKTTIFALVTGASLAVPSPAAAQIFSWRDADGQLVLSNRKPANANEVRSYAVPEAETVRVTRYAAANRSRPYDDLIEEHARLNGVRTDLVRAVIQVESGFNPAARSPKGAMGLMQLMPATARELGVANPYNPAENIRGGVAYLRQLLDRYQDHEELALAAYNAGPAAVDKHGENIPPYRETRDYVSRINRMAGAAGPRPIELRSGQIYKVTEVVDGREVVRYTDKKPSTGAYSVVGDR
jgi:soluble lytic murein transglycosylase-like protein